MLRPCEGQMDLGAGTQVFVPQYRLHARPCPMVGRDGGHRRNVGQAGGAGTAMRGTVQVPAGSGSVGWGQENPVLE